MTIKQKQCLLLYLGYYTGEVDGIWGDNSRCATEAFQRNYGLTVDGIFGIGTEARIREVVASGELPQQPQDTPGTEAQTGGRISGISSVPNFAAPAAAAAVSRWSRRNPSHVPWTRFATGWVSRFPLWTAVVPACGVRRTMRRSAVWPILSICMGRRPICTVPQVRRR